MRHQARRPSKLKAVKHATHWGKRLDEWRLEEDLSIRDFAALCENRIGKTTVHRICSGGLEPRMEGLVKPIIADSVRKYMRSKGATDIAIEREICAIFSELHKEAPPVFTDRTALSPVAQRFFGLTADPFDPGQPRDVAEVFTAPQFDACLAHVMDSVKFQGFNALIGEVGSGKTTIKRRAADICKKSNGKLQILWPDFPNMEKVHAGSIASSVLRHFEAGQPRDLVARAELLKRLLVRLAEREVTIALGFDECHRLDPRLLTALKNFWELGDGGFDRYIGLVLFGQLRFKEVLDGPEFREISERLNIIRLPSLGKHAGEYLAHRLALCGGRLEKLFHAEALPRMVALAGTPQALGNVANAALMDAHRLGSKVVLADFIPEKSGEPKVRAIRARGGK